MNDRTTPIFGSSTARALLAGCVLFGALGHHAASAEDAVYYQSGPDGKQIGHITGTILDYTGKELVLKTAGGQTTTLPSDRVERIESQWTDKQNQAEAFLSAGQYAEALATFQAALRSEKRKWVQRMILAQLVTCHRELGQIDRAGQAFLAVLHDDPATPYIDRIPLAWYPREPSASVMRAAQVWLNRSDDAAAQLMGASWLLSTAKRAEAIRTLRRLASSADRRIAQLANAQLWRTELVTLDQRKLGRWQKQIEAMPESLRAGPYFVLGRGLARKGQAEAAALALLRVPILYPHDLALAAKALTAAGEQLEKIRQPREAASLYREVLAQHPDSDAAPEAKALLENLLEKE